MRWRRGSIEAPAEYTYFLWWLEDDARLRPRVIDAISSRSNEILISVASLWEILVKITVRKLGADIREIDGRVAAEGFGRLAIGPAHLATLATLPFHHRDPFDHLLMAQAISEDIVLVSDDRMMAKYPVQLS